MEKIVYTTVIAIVSITAFGQQAKPFKFGFELDGKLKKIYPNTLYDSPTGVAYVGMFAEFHATNHFSGKFRVGLNNTYYHEDEHTTYSIEGESYTFPGITTVKSTLGISLEPRFYFFSTKQLRKINFYAALPVMFETAPAWNEPYFSYVCSEFMIIPALGIRYDFTKHLGIEVSGGLGWGRYFSKYGGPIRMQEMEYSLSAGLRYAF